jgi:uroporphyrin-III C-methyltransferase
MTEQNNSSAINEEITSMGKEPDNQAQKKSQGAKNTLAVLALVIALAAGAGCYYLQRQLQQQQVLATQLNQQITQLQQQSQNTTQQVDSRFAQTANVIDKTEQQQHGMQEDLVKLAEKINAITANDSSIWSIAEANYLVKMAERKIWSDHDLTTAMTLLKGADETLASLDDPSILTLRQALNADIAKLSNMTQIDYDGIILQLNQLANQVDNLRIQQNTDEGAPMELSNPEVSASLLQWRENLVKSWHDFMDNFISIRRRDTSAQPLLAPDQEIYLRENIRSGLLIAAQAVPRHQEEIYQQSLESIATWVRAWYDNSDPTTRSFLENLDKLSQQQINMTLPDKLESQPLLNKLMQTRVRGFMTGSASSVKHGGS